MSGSRFRNWAPVPGPAGGRRSTDASAGWGERPFGFLRAAAAFAVLSTGLVPVAFADGPAMKVRPLFVDENNPSAWPKGLEPVPARELRRLLSSADGGDSRQPSAEIEQAVYRATFNDGQLRDGQASFVIRHRDPVPAFVLLGHPSVTLAKPRWLESDGAKSGNEDALWGTDAGGRRCLFAPPHRSRLECGWSLAGRSVLGSTEFAIVLPTAVVSEVLIRVPDDCAVDSSAGVVSKTDRSKSALSKSAKPTDRGWDEWRIVLGGETSCRLRIERKRDAANKPVSAVFFDQDTAYLAGAERLQIRSSLQLDVFSAPLTSFALSVPSDVRVETIASNDVPLSFRVKRMPDSQQVDVALPEPFAGKGGGRTIVVEASTATRTHQLWTLPRVDVASAVRRTGQAELTIAPPLKLIRFGPHPPSQTANAQLEAPLYGADGEETYRLQDSDPSRPLVVEVGEPAASYSCAVLERLDLRRDRCAFRSDVICSATEGSAFSIEGELPDAWDVTNVQPVGEVSRIVHWTTRPAAGHKKRLSIDFFRAVTKLERKRFLVEGTRPVPRTGETIDLPIIRFAGPRGARRGAADAQTIVTHSSAIDLALDPPGEFVPFGQAVLPAGFLDSSIIPDARSLPDERAIVHQTPIGGETRGGGKTGGGSPARLMLRRGEQGYSARVHATVDVGTSQMAERVAVNLTPEAGALDRIFIYLTSEGPPFTWLSATDRPRPLDASRVAPSRHSEWNLPASGELWEIRLPEPQKASFRVEGSRKTSSLGPGAIGLAYLPETRSFSGIVEVRFDDALQFQIEARGPKPARPSPARVPADPRGEARVVRTWSYERPTDSLVLKPRPNGSAELTAACTLLDLHSFFDRGGGAAGDDTHRAVFSVAPMAETRPFRFVLDAAARLTLVSVNGNAVRVQRRAGEVTVPSLPSDRWNSVQIDYKTPPSAHLFREKRAVPVPRPVDAEVIQFHWQFSLPAGVELEGEPAGLRLTESFSTLSWSERLFGPLGRPTSELHLPALADAPWPADFGFAADRPPDLFAELDAGRPPPNPDWTVWHAWAPDLPADLALATWHEPEIRVLAWIVCLGWLTAGWALARRVGPSRFLKVAPLVVVALAAAASLVVPPAFALPVGACTAGTLLAAGFSVPWRKRETAVASPTPLPGRPGSTVSFQLPAILFLLGVGIAGAAAMGQETVSRRKSVPLFSPGRLMKVETPDDPAPPELLVVVPVGPGAADSKTVSPLADDDRLLYVPRDALAALRRANREHPIAADFLFLSAEYVVTPDERQAPAIEARYRVAVTSADLKAINLPLSHVTLAGADACRVNGRWEPVRDGAGGFVVSLDSPVAAPPAKAPPPAPAPAPIRPRIFEIVLRFFPKTDGTGNPARFEFGIPSVAATTLRLVDAKRLPPLPLPLTVETDKGAISLRSGGGDGGNGGREGRGDLTADLGETRHVRVAPARAPEPPMPWEARGAQLVRVGPHFIELNCRVSYAGTKSASGADAGAGVFEWLVPSQAAIRALGSEDNVRIERGEPIEGTGAVGGGEKLVPLRFAPVERPKGPLTIGATLMIPITGSTSKMQVPLVRFAGSPGSAAVRLISNQLGVTTIPGYRASLSTNEPNLAHTPAVDPSLRQEPGGGHRDPDYVVQNRGLEQISVELVPIVPTHRARVTHEARFSPNRLSWTTTAEIRTEDAPAFVHVLEVDPRLSIESVSVQEDNVERLVRYSQSGSEVTLFLRDRAAATQDLTLAASMPIDLDRETPLPSVRLVGAGANDARLLLEADPEVELAVTAAAGITALPREPNGRDETPDKRMPRLVREYLVRSGAKFPSVRATRRILPEGGHKPADLPVAGRAMAPQPPAAAAPIAARVAVGLDFSRETPPVGSLFLLVDEARTEPVLWLRWPPGKVLRGALVDGRPVQAVTEKEGQLGFPLPTEGRRHRLFVHWIDSPGRTLSAAQSFRETLPLPVEFDADTILLALSVPADVRAVMPRSFVPIEPAVFEKESQTIANVDAKGNSDQAAGAPACPAFEGESGRRTVGRLKVDRASHTIQIWTFRDLLWEVPLAVAGSVLLFACLWRLTALGHWLADREFLALAAIGAAWWLCLAPRVIGVALVLAALVWFAARERGRKSRRAGNLPSTLHQPV